MDYETHIQTLRTTWMMLTRNFAAQLLKAQVLDYEVMKNDITHLAEFAQIIDKIKPAVQPSHAPAQARSCGLEG